MIKAVDYIKTAFSANDAEKLSREIENSLLVDKHISVDFQQITIFTTLFFNNTFAKYVSKLGPKEYNETFTITGLSDLGKATYEHSYQNAVNYYNLSEEAKKEHDDVIAESED